MRKSYSEKLLDPRWQKRRLQVFQYAGWRCQICGCSTRTLHAHHSYYKRGKEPWQYPKGAIIAVCNTCHAKLHPEHKTTPAPMPIFQTPMVAPFVPMSDMPVEKAAAENRFAEMKRMLES